MSGILKSLKFTLLTVLCLFLSSCAVSPAVSPGSPPPVVLSESPPPSPEEAGVSAPVRLYYIRDTVRFEAGVREAAKLVKSDSRQDYPSGAAFANFREIKMGAIPGRVLYRGSHPAQPGNPRFPYAQQLAENARVATVLNLSDTPKQIALYGEDIPWYQNFINRNTIIPLVMGADYTQREFEIKLKEGLLFMASHNPPYLIHGIEGRERTGFFVALLEALMGASSGEIKADYMLSYVNLYKIFPEEERYAVISYLAEDILQKIRGDKDPAHRDLQKDAERYILENIGLSQGELEALKRKLTGASKF